MKPSPSPASRRPTPRMLRQRRQTLRVWARGVVRARLHTLETELGRLERLPSADTIHDTRVASRRLRFALRHLEPCFPALEVQRLRLEARRVARILGAVRDLDVLMENLAGDARHKGSPLSVLLSRLRRRRENTLNHAIPEAHQLRLHLPAWRTRLGL